MRLIDRVDWKWTDPWNIELDDGSTLPLLAMDNDLWSHHLRDAVRRARLRTLRNKRPHLLDAQHMNYPATVALVRSKELTPYQRGTLRSILADALYTCDRLKNANQLLSDL